FHPPLLSASSTLSLHDALPIYSCIDLYEESVWQIAPVLNAELVKKVQAGTSTLTDLTNGGATPLGCFDGQSAYPANFPSDGNWTDRKSTRLNSSHDQSSYAVLC